MILPPSSHSTPPNAGRSLNSAQRSRLAGVSGPHEQVATVNLNLPPVEFIGDRSERARDTQSTSMDLRKRAFGTHDDSVRFAVQGAAQAGRPRGGTPIRLLRRIGSIFFATLVVGYAAPTVTLVWDPNPESNIAGYRLQYGTTSRNPSTIIDVGNTTTRTVAELAYSTTYYFTVTAYNTAGLESGRSSEVSHTTLPLGTQRLTVENGSGSGDYTPGTQVPVVADTPPADQKFERWMSDYQVLLVPTASTTTATIPYQDVKITATYSALPRYILTVNNGSGGGSYRAGALVSVSANPPEGRQLSTWAGKDVALLADRTSATTTLAMPARASTVTANHVAVYVLTVNGGAGSGSYPVGKVVSVQADPPPSGQRFSAWTGDTGRLASRTSANTTVTIPSRAISITATYRRR